MDKFFVVMLAGLGVITLFIVLTPVESAIPPTNAFSKVFINGQLVEADKYNDELYIITSGSFNTTISGDSVTIKLKSITCPLLQAIKGVDADGNLVCATI